MPELPEVETMCRGIRGIIGMRVIEVMQPPCACRPCVLEPGVHEMRRRLLGQRVTDIERRGKRVMIVFESEQRLVIEPRMSGLVLLTEPPSVDYLRLRIDFDPCHFSGGNGRGAERGEPSGRSTESVTRRTDRPGPLLIWDRRGLGTIRLLSSDEYETRVNSRLGEDALTISTDDLRQRLGRSGRAIKVALLDQTAVAGIGNLYAAEILFVAGIDPRLRCDKLTRPQWTRLHAAIGTVLTVAIAYEGSTLSDGTYRNALNNSGGYQNMHRVYDRAGDICSRCGEGVIRRIVQVQRATFFCPRCQRRSGKHVAVGEISAPD